MKSTHRILIGLAVVMVPALLFAKASTFMAGKAVPQSSSNLVVVPLEITNGANLAAMDIPISFTEGVTLREVTFNDTRVSYFDLKIANIDNANRTVVIGLVPQMTSEFKPNLSAGTGSIANLVFEVTDPSVNSVTLEAIQLSEPDHELMFVYAGQPAEGTTDLSVDKPEFERVTVSFAAGSGSNLPTSFGLNQNYPNPFNPTTNISFDVPKASHVELSVYNVLGQKVVSLVNQDMEPGSHTVAWDASNNSSGVYYYRIAAGTFAQTKKMVLLK
ncbi:MAG: T9SS type A sorting domain-containing protein [Candidatus Zixiibacteriota bacterium]